MSQNRIAIESYGCTMNKGEARRAAAILEELGYHVLPVDVSSSIDAADTILLFTCDVISTTEIRMWKRIDEMISTGRSLIVAGCLPRIKGKEIIERYPDVLLMDSMGISRLKDSIEKLFPVVEVEDMSVRPAEVVNRVDHIVTLSSGCLGACTYCITKHARGGHVSNTPETIIENIMKGIKNGRREILLASQDTGAYGSDLDPEIDLGDLLRTITGNNIGRTRFRIGMMNPDHLIEHLPSILEGYDDPSIFKFFHIPVQSGSERILELMGRRYSPSKIPGLFDSIRKRFPDVVISTDIIAGFPTETMEDHRMSLEMIRELVPDILNVTRFSRREGTPAASMKDQVYGWVSKERSRDFTNLHSKLLKKKMEERLGYHRDCLITEVGKPGTMMARDGNYMPLVIDGGKELLGTFQDIQTDRTGPTYLLGRVV